MTKTLTHVERFLVRCWKAIVCAWFRFLAFFRFLDADGNLSITNLLIYVIVVKLYLQPELDFAAVSALLVTVINYSLKREGVNKSRKNDKTTDSIKEISDKVDSFNKDRLKKEKEILNELGEVKLIHENAKRGF